MPIGAITMILTNVGLHIYNNWCGSRQNKQLQQKREEFERAAKERNTQRMWQLMREGQELTMQLEKEKHQQRLEELKNDIGSLLQKLAYAATVNNWPLNVLPIVMKNQALGNLLANQEESIALHCIFTPSNSYDINRTVFPRVEEALETYCNQHWSVLSDHPILFYSGAWKSQQAPTEVQIDSMRTALGNLPTLVITPFFRPNDGKLVFHVRMWGVGASSSDEFSIPEIKPTDFQRKYQTGDDYVNDTELMDELIEDLVPYLQCIIGYMADTYFWSSLGKAPHLPLLVTNGTINTDGMKYLVDDSREYYDKLYSDAKADDAFLMDNTLLSLSESVLCFETISDGTNRLHQLFLERCSVRSSQSFQTIETAIDKTIWFLEDLAFLRKVLRISEGLGDTASFQSLYNLVDSLEEIDYDYQVLDSKDVSVLESKANQGDAVAVYRLGELYEYAMGVNTDEEKSKLYYQQALKKGFFLAEIKLGLRKINSLSKRNLEILRQEKVLQIEVLYSDMLLQSEKVTKETVDELYKLISSNYLATGRIYKHPGLITNLALLMRHVGYPPKVFKPMLEMAGRMGYNKAKNILKQII